MGALGAQENLSFFVFLGECSVALVLSPSSRSTRGLGILKDVHRGPLAVRRSLGEIVTLLIIEEAL